MWSELGQAGARPRGLPRHVTDSLGFSKWKHGEVLKLNYYIDQFLKANFFFQRKITRTRFTFLNDDFGYQHGEQSGRATGGSEWVADHTPTRPRSLHEGHAKGIAETGGGRGAVFSRYRLGGRGREEGWSGSHT